MDILNKIEKVDVPPFLQTRIEAKIQDLQMQKVPKQWYVIAITTCFLLFAVNFLIIKSNKTSTNNQESVLVEAYGLNTSNQLYND
jgi:hypothetical protein